MASCANTHVTRRRASGARRLRRPRRRGRRGDLVAQDRRLQRAQLRRRLDAQAVDERLVRAAVGLQRVRLPPGAVEREHLLAAQPLAQRMLAHERLELADHLGVAAAGEVRVDPVAQARQPQVLQPRDLRLREALVGDVRERRAAPQRERPSQRRRRLPRLAARELGATAPEELLEPVGVERSRRQPQRVAAALGDEHALAERAAKPRRHARWTAFRPCCGPAPSHSSSTARSTCTTAPRCTSSSASSESVRPRGTRAAPTRPRSARGSGTGASTSRASLSRSVSVGVGERVQKARAVSLPACSDPPRSAPTSPGAARAVGHARGDRSPRLLPRRGSRIPTASARSSRRSIDAIGMRAHGPLMIERFGDGELEGWSAMQFIETSSITVHADEVVGPLLRRRLLLPAVRPRRAAAVAVEHFGGTRHADGAATMIELAPVLGVLAGVIGVADTIPYVRDTLRGATRPHRGTWLIWGVLAIVVCLSQRADGASWSLVMAAAQAALTSLVFLLAIRRGEGGVSAAELVLIAIAGAGVVGWIVADEPLVATACVVAPT